jgi:hypothetical protein
MRTHSDKLTNLQLELLKSFSYISDEKEVKEIKSLLNYYFRHKLNEAIDKEESNRNYTAAIYEEWLRNSNK